MYNCKISSLVYSLSSCIVSNTSFIFLDIVLSEVKNIVLDSCCVIVEPPCTVLPFNIFFIKALTIPFIDIPQCL